MKYIISCLVFVILTFYPTFAYAEKIDEFKTDIIVNKDGTINVTERITYNFDNENRRGIYRNIPTTVLNTKGKKYELTIQNIQVTSTTAPNNTQITNNNEQLRIKIGDKNIYITGKHTYNITYTIRGAISYFDTFDELYWNITGNDWNVPISQVFATVQLPDQTQITKHTCYVGIRGSQNNCDGIVKNASYNVYFENLKPKEGITIAISFPTNTVAKLEPKLYTSFWDIAKEPWAIVLEIIAGLISLALLIQFLRVPQIRTVSAYIDIPKIKSGRILTPLELGALADGSADPKDLVALIVGLAQKGYITIHAQDKDELLGKKTVFSIQLVKQPDHELTQYEKRMVHALFSDVSDKMDFTEFFTNNAAANSEFAAKTKQLQYIQQVLPAITKDTFVFDSSADNKSLYVVQQTIKDDVYKELIAGGIFNKDPRSQFSLFYIVAFVITLIGGFSGQVILFMVGFVSIFIGAFITSSTNQFRKLLTPYGLDALGKILSLKNFLKSQERSLNYQGDKQLLFEKLLPYAVALGVEKNWAKRFEQFNIQNPSWYNSTAHGSFNAAAFSNTLSSFNSAVSSTGMSSASSGGGSSGGGGGGGGGGSW